MYTIGGIPIDQLRDILIDDTTQVLERLKNIAEEDVKNIRADFDPVIPELIKELAQLHSLLQHTHDRLEKIAALIFEKALLKP